MPYSKQKIAVFLDQQYSRCFAIEFKIGYHGITEKGIALDSAFTAEEVIKRYGPPEWKGCGDCNEMMMGYPGIEFRIDRELSLPQYPFVESAHLNKTIKKMVIVKFPEFK